MFKSLIRYFIQPSESVLHFVNCCINDPQNAKIDHYYVRYKGVTVWVANGLLLYNFSNIPTSFTIFDKIYFYACIDQINAAYIKELCNV